MTANYWDEQRMQLSFPDENDYRIYRIKKLLGHAMHKLIAIEQQQEILQMPDEALKLIHDIKDPKAAKAIAQRRLSQGNQIYAHADDASDGNHIGTRSKKANFILEAHFATTEGLIALYESLPTQIFCGKSYGETLDYLIPFLKDQLAINSENKIILATTRKALKQHRKLQAQKALLLSKLKAKGKSGRKAQIARLKEIKALIHAARKDARQALLYRPQKKLSWTGLRPELEIAQAHTRAAEIHGNGAADALATAFSINNSALSKARKLLNQYSLNKSGQHAEHMASSFPGFPEATDLLQTGLLAAHQTERNRTQSIDSGALNKAISCRWTDLKRAASADKRDLAAAMKGPLAHKIAQPEAEENDPLEALDLDFLLAQAQEHLTEAQWKAFKLCEIDQMPQREAASFLGIEQCNISRNLTAAKNNLRQLITA